MTSPVPAGPAAAWMPAVATALAKTVRAAIAQSATDVAREHLEASAEDDDAEDSGDDAKARERSDPFCRACPAAVARAADQTDQRRADVAAEYPRDHRVEHRGAVGILGRQRLDVGDADGPPALRSGDAVERRLQRDGGRPVSSRGDEQAVRSGLVGAVDLTVVDLRQRIGTGRGLTRIERVTGQAV
jgi:hypothetical protein